MHRGSYPGHGRTGSISHRTRTTSQIPLLIKRGIFDFVSK